MWLFLFGLGLGFVIGFFLIGEWASQTITRIRGEHRQQLDSLRHECESRFRNYIERGE